MNEKKIQAGNYLSKSFLNNIFFLVFVIFVVGCSTTGVDRNSLQRNYQVSVSTGGVPLQNFERQLVHRFQVSSTELKNVLAPWPRTLNLPFHGREEFDADGLLVGIKIINKNQISTLPELGLQAGDIVTAIGWSQPRNERDFWHLFNELEQNGESSLSISRAGKANKMLYQLRN